MDHELKENIWQVLFQALDALNCVSPNIDDKPFNVVINKAKQEIYRSIALMERKGCVPKVNEYGEPI